MAHDWKNDWIKPGVEVLANVDGQELPATVGILSHDAKLVMVLCLIEGATVEKMIARDMLRPKDAPPAS